MLKIIEKRNLWLTCSMIIIMIGGIFMIQNLLNQKPILNFGIDFTGGTNMILQSSNPSKPLTISNVNLFNQILIESNINHYQVQLSQSNEILIKTSLLSYETRKNILKKAKEAIPSLELLEADTIGPSIGLEMKKTSFWIITIVSIMLLLYITWRFRFVYGVSALLALIHDSLITFSLSAILQIEINLAFIAAFLTILGYSINDTIVIFDRIRENVTKNPETPIKLIANQSIGQTLMRSINTSLTTLFVVGAMFIFGGLSIQAFSLVLLIGILSGTYSSIFIASPILVSIWKDPITD